VELSGYGWNRHVVPVGCAGTKAKAKRDPSACEQASVRDAQGKLDDVKGDCNGRSNGAQANSGLCHSIRTASVCALGERWVREFL